MKEVRVVPQDMPGPDMVAKLKESPFGLHLTKKEVSLFTKDRISYFINNRGLNAPSSANKSDLIEILFGG